MKNYKQLLSILIFLFVSKCFGKHTFEYNVLMRNPHDTKHYCVDDATLVKNVEGQELDITKFMHNQVYISNRFIRRALVLSHENVSFEGPPIVLIVAHGTWARNSPEYFREYYPTCQHLKNFAGRMSEKEKRPVLLLFFEWSGENKDERRHGAAAVLAELINLFESEKSAARIIGIAHSHGFNLFTAASHSLERPIDLLIGFGAPVRGIVPDVPGEERYRPESGKIKEIINFYSENDPIQTIGSVVTNNPFSLWRSLNAPRKQPSQPDKRIINVGIKFNGVSPGHVTMKDMMVGLFDLIERINEHYRIHDDLIADVFYVENKTIISIVINEFLHTDDLFSRDYGSLLVDEAFLYQLKREVFYSQEQEFQFRRVYFDRKVLREKGTAARYIGQLVFDLVRLGKLLIEEKVVEQWLKVERDTVIGRGVIGAQSRAD